MNTKHSAVRLHGYADINSGLAAIGTDLERWAKLGAFQRRVMQRPAFVGIHETFDALDIDGKFTHYLSAT